MNPQELDAVVQFHGHLCPGLAIGVRAAELALSEIGPHAADEEVVAIVETDMCGVQSALRFLSCTESDWRLRLARARTRGGCRRIARPSCGHGCGTSQRRVSVASCPHNGRPSAVMLACLPDHPLTRAPLALDSSSLRLARLSLLPKAHN